MIEPYIPQLVFNKTKRRNALIRKYRLNGVRHSLLDYLSEELLDQVDLCKSEEARRLILGVNKDGSRKR